MPEVSNSTAAIILVGSIITYAAFSALPWILNWSNQPVTYMSIWYVPFLSGLLALMEIEIEGTHEWAARIPTLAINGKSGLTFYHVFFAMSIIAAISYVFVAPASRKLDVSTSNGRWEILDWIQGIAGTAMAVFLLEDIFWYMFNPKNNSMSLRSLYGGVAKGHPCIKIGNLHLPIGYILLAAGAMAVGSSKEQTIVLPSQILSTVILGLTVGYGIRFWYFLRRKGKLCAPTFRPAC